MKILVFIIYTYSAFLSATPLVWEEISTLSTQGINASAARIGIDAQGNIIAIWLENDQLVAKTKQIETDWPVTPSILSASHANSPQLIVTPNGTVAAIWEENGIIYTTSMLANGIWEQPIPLSQNNSSSPQITGDSSGNLIAIWVSNQTIQSSYKTNTGTWSNTPDTLSSPDIPSTSPQVAIGDNGRVVAVWQGTCNTIDVIYSSCKTESSSWSPPQIISNVNIANTQPHVAVSSTGTACAVWYRYQKDNFSYSGVVAQCAFYSTNNSWSTPTDFSLEGLRNPSDLAMKIKYNPIGLAMVLFTNSYDGQTFTITGKCYGSDGWVDFPMDNNLSIYDCDLTTSLDGSAFSIHMKCEDSLLPCLEIRYANSIMPYGNMSQLTSPVLMYPSGYPRIACININDVKYIAIIWLSFNGENIIIQSSTGKGDLRIPSPINVSVTRQTNTFGIYTEYYDSLSWEHPGFSSDKTIGWLIFKNGVLQGGLPFDSTQYVEHNVHPNEDAIYGVALYENNGNMSPIISVHAP